jgi:cell division protein FtsB
VSDEELMGRLRLENGKLRFEDAQLRKEAATQQAENERLRAERDALRAALKKIATLRPNSGSSLDACIDIARQALEEVEKCMTRN